MTALRTIIPIVAIWWTAQAARQSEAIAQPAISAPSEVSPIVIPLAGPISDRESEISGMAWHDDQLYLLPQYPGRVEPGVSCLYMLERSDIEAYLDEPVDEPLVPREIPLETANLDETIEGFEGFEAIVFRGDELYLTIEVENEGRGGPGGYLVRGRLTADGIQLDATSLAPLSLPVAIQNMGFESLLVTEDRLITLFEANGLLVNPRPEAAVFSADLTESWAIPIDAIEYRITDVTEVDVNGHFWAINYYWPGDQGLATAIDPLVERFGEGLTHLACRAVERLVEFELTQESISLTGRAPIQLNLLGEDEPRNWEGVVRLGERGFLLATDQHPQTLLGFVPFAIPPAR